MPSASPAARRSLAWSLAALSMIGPFSIDAAFPSLPLLGMYLGVDSAALQQLISVYLVMYAAINLSHGAIPGALGHNPVIVAGMLVYALALAPTYPVLLVCLWLLAPTTP